MKKIITLAAAIVCAAAAYAESYYIATVTDFTGAKTFSVVTKAEAKEIELDIKRKNALFQKVLTEIQNEFKKNPEAHKGEKFYGNRLKPMTIKLSTQPFNNLEKAQEKAEKLQAHEDGTDVDEKDAKKKPKKLSDSQKLRAVKEAERDYAVKMFGEEVVKIIEERLAAAATAAEEPAK